ncbi:UDP-N-acetylmuramate dehydrogenase [Nonlabens ponticola]|uniref:UDP-N-acetylmuramate dehydrogenase n=1 Tax=Nonlabens ponticola TaxID=2496866 RepID=UPI0019D17353
MQIQHHVALKEFNTFGISAFAKAYTPINIPAQFKEAASYYKGEQVFLLGGGSNMLLIDDISRPVLHVLTKGIETQAAQNGEIHITAQAGENWHEFVLYCIKNNYAGIENLSLIPGNIGTSPIQNIGAYGVELKDVFNSCTVIDLQTLEEKSLSLEECNFGYRDSVFKKEAAGKYIITSVTFKLQDLSINPDYKLKTSYGAIQEELDRLGGEPDIALVSQAVINIRTSKLPDPKIIGNSGSFFKNPIIKRDRYDELVRLHPHMPSYNVDDDHVKVPAGWLIDQCGFKGYRKGDAGVHDKQALVLVNHGKATGKEIISLSREIQEKVNSRFGISIDTEVNLIENM